MSARELAAWAAFERHFGPLTVQERLDAAAALVAWCVCRALGATREPDPAGFMPRWSEPGTRAAQSVEQMIAVIRRLQGRRDG